MALHLKAHLKGSYEGKIYVYVMCRFHVQFKQLVYSNVISTLSVTSFTQFTNLDMIRSGVDKWTVYSVLHHWVEGKPGSLEARTGQDSVCPYSS